MITPFALVGKIVTVLEAMPARAILQGISIARARQIRARPRSVELAVDIRRVAIRIIRRKAQTLEDTPGDDTRSRKIGPAIVIEPVGLLGNRIDPERGIRRLQDIIAIG